MTPRDEETPALFDLPLQGSGAPQDEAEEREERHPDRPAGAPRGPRRREPTEESPAGGREATPVAPAEADGAPAPDRPAEPSRRRRGAGESAPASAPPDADRDTPGPRPVTTSPPPRPAPAPRRLGAGLLDLLLLAGVAAVMAAGLLLMDVELEPAVWPGVGLFLLTFSFFYVVVPLAFWGATAGMTGLDLVARSEDDRHLTFGQATRRWLTGVVTVLALGVPALLAFVGVPLADRVSGSRTDWEPTG